MVNTEEQYFAMRGGDDYFHRNLAGQDIPQSSHYSLELLIATAADKLQPNGHAAVLGGSGGRLAAGVQDRLPGWKVSNVDISPEAIRFGRQTFPQLEHHCLSISSANPRLLDILGQLDIIFVNAVLHWIQRSNLSRAIANIDESLRDGGLLLIWDFVPPTRRKNLIKHAPGNFTYKQDYSQSFLSLGTYETLASRTHFLEHPSDIDIQERRVASNLLRKNLTGLYPHGYAG